MKVADYSALFQGLISNRYDFFALVCCALFPDGVSVNAWQFAGFICRYRRRHHWQGHAIGAIAIFWAINFGLR